MYVSVSHDGSLQISVILTVNRVTGSDKVWALTQ